MADIVIETDRLVLRRIEEGDALLHNQILNTTKLMEYLGGVMELHEIEAKHAKGMAMFAKEGFSFFFAIEKASGTMVGHAGMKRVDNVHAPNLGDHEIGWIIREDRWRRGYAYEAMQAVIEWAFASIGAPHLVALTAERNQPSWRLMEKLGMHRRRDLDFIDPNFAPEDNPTIQYSISRDEWEAEK